MWMFGDTRIKKNTFCRDKSPTLQKAYILRKYYYLTRFILIKKIMNTLLVSRIMIIKLSNYISCFQKGVHMWKVMMEKTKWMYFLIDDDDLLEKYNTVWEKVSPDINKNLIMSISVINILWKRKQILMVIKWQIFLIKTFLK